MCGICGQFNYRSDTPVEEQVIRRMTSTITHRGPDDEGFFISGPVGLGFRRLSIIDLSGGHQPMSDAEETVWVVFNGEIYNYPELKSELQSHGHKFRTRSDTEVIVHGYKQWGKEVFNRLNGMFGIALWDVKARRLLVSRDAMGIKLIYYRVNDGILTFGSEVRPVLAAGNERPEVNAAALHQFLRFRYTPSPLTIYEGIRKLAPGTMLVVEKGECREERWYNYVPKPFEREKTDAEAVEELWELYRGAVKRHLLSDVPVGILLSGGLDSGLLLALMNEHGAEWPAYTVGYGESFKDDELNDAAETARLLGAKHAMVRLDQNEFEKALPNIVKSLEEPIAASSIVPMYFVCQRARQDVKVALFGQGPDELFGGYKRHVGVRYGEMWRRLPGSVQSIVSSAVSCLPRNETLKRGVQSLGISERLERYRQVFSLAAPSTIHGLFRNGALDGESSATVYEPWTDLLPQMEFTDELGGLQLLELRASLPDELLMYGDKLSMAHSLEGRVPYLDRTVVEYVQRLGANFKVRNRTRKWLHRKVCEKYLPETIVRRKKKGFAVNVVDDWFNSSVEGHLSQMLLDSSSRMFGLLDPSATKRLLEDHQTGRQDNHKLLFSLALFEQWLRAGDVKAGA